MLYYWENTPYSLANSGNFHQRNTKANEHTRGRDSILMVERHTEKRLDHMSHRRGVAGKQCKNLASVPDEKMPSGPTFTCFGDYMSLKRLQRLRHSCRNGSRTVRSPKTCWQSTSTTWSLSVKWVLGPGWGQRVTQIPRAFVMCARRPSKSSQVTILITAPFI